MPDTAAEHTVEYSAGEMLFKEGDSSKDLFIIQSGVVKVFKEVEGRRLPIALVHSGQFIGELSFFDGKPRSASAQAATDVKALKLDKARLETEIKKLPSWLLVMIRSIADRMRESNELLKRNNVLDSKTEQEFKRWEPETKA